MEDVEQATPEDRAALDACLRLAGVTREAEFLNLPGITSVSLDDVASLADLRECASKVPEAAVTEAEPYGGG